jgi:alkylation response protein AidB-like acyl-CoA dehydrogenase
MDFSACEVIFENTPIPVKNVLGEVGGGILKLFTFKYALLLNFTVLYALLLN